MSQLDMHGGAFKPHHIGDVFSASLLSVSMHVLDICYL